MLRSRSTDNSNMLLLTTQPTAAAWPISPRCKKCVFRQDCGGPDNPSLFNCLETLCCGTGNCDEVCPHHPLYYARLAEVGGIRFDDFDVVPQLHVRPPIYVPHMPHRYSRNAV